MSKGNDSITKFLQKIKGRADELALLGSRFDDENLIDRILEALGDDYKEFGRDV